MKSTSSKSSKRTALFYADSKGRIQDPTGFPLLYSYYYTRKGQVLPGGERVDPVEYTASRMGSRVNLILDSGAFSAFRIGKPIDLDEYMEYCWKYKDQLWGYVSLDVLSEPEKTLKNYRTMLKQGLNPIPVHPKGAPKKHMDEYFESSPLVMLGGIVQNVRVQGAKASSPALRTVARKMNWADGRPVHWLGQCAENLLRAFLPFSCDNSSWSSGVRYGRLWVYLGRGNWYSLFRSRDLRNLKSLKQIPKEVERELTTYGFGVGDLYDIKKWKNYSEMKTLTLDVTCKSYVRYVSEFREEFGTRIFMAHSNFGSTGSSYRMTDTLLNAIEVFG